MLKLQPVAAEVLAAVEMEADRPFGEIGEMIGRPASTVRYHLEGLIDEGVVVRRRTYLDNSVLGFTNFAIFFSLASESQKTRERIAKKIAAHPNVTWFAELGGEFQYATSYAARHVSEVVSFLDLDIMVERYGAVLFEKTIVPRVRLHTFGRKYLGKLRLPAREMKQGGVSKFTPDVTDGVVLSALARSTFQSFRELARESGIAASTFDRRLKLLRDAGVIQGHYYILDVTKFGIQEYRLIVRAKGASPAFREELLGFARENPWIRKFIECIGSWDFELEMDAFSSEEVSAVTNVLYGRFGSRIQGLTVTPLFREISCSPYSAGA